MSSPSQGLPAMRVQKRWRSGRRRSQASSKRRRASVISWLIGSVTGPHRHDDRAGENDTEYPSDGGRAGKDVANLGVEIDAGMPALHHRPMGRGLVLGVLAVMALATTSGSLRPLPSPRSGPLVERVVEDEGRRPEPGVH